jgi:hypothetical protein
MFNIKLSKLKTQKICCKIITIPKIMTLKSNKMNYIMNQNVNIITMNQFVTIMTMNQNVNIITMNQLVTIITNVVVVVVVVAIHQQNQNL